MQQEEIPHLLGGQIQRENSKVLIRKDIKPFLLQEYASEKFTNQEAEQILREMMSFPASDLYDSNKSIMKMLSDGLKFTR